MRSIRNFFHDINDILLALIIVVIASGIIYWRLNIILDYPKQLAAEQATYEQEDVAEEETADAEGAAAEEAAAEESAESAEEGPQG